MKELKVENVEMFNSLSRAEIILILLNLILNFHALYYT